MSIAVDRAAGFERRALGVEELGELVPISRFGGQGRVYRPAAVPAGLGAEPVVVKLYRRPPPAGAGDVLTEMVAWAHLLPDEQRAALHELAAWPLAVVRAGSGAAGIVMRDVTARFAAPFVMPSGRRERVLLTLEHLLGTDAYLQMRGLGVRLDTFTRAEVAERICDAIAFLHRHAIVASDIAPNNLLVAFGAGDEPEVCFIDCDSMVFHGRSALTSVQTGDWEIPAAFAESPGTRAADAYKLGLVVLRLFARSHDARAPAPIFSTFRLSCAACSPGRSPPTPSTDPPPANGSGRCAGRLPTVASTSATPAPRRHGGSWRPRDRSALRVRRQTRGRWLECASAGARAAGGHGTSARPAFPGVQVNGALWLRRAVVVAWIVAGTAVLLLVLSRLFAAAIPVPDSGNAGAGSQFGPGANSTHLYQPYYYPRPRSVLPGSPGFSSIP